MYCSEGVAHVCNRDGALFEEAEQLVVYSKLFYKPNCTVIILSTA